MTTTTVDSTEPYLFYSLLSYSPPSNGSMSFQVNQNIGLHFSEAVTAGSGNITISNGTDTRVIDIRDSEQVIFKPYHNVIINPTEDLLPDTTYSVRMTSGVIVDLAANAFAGINDEIPLNLTTVADTSSPLLLFGPSSRNSIFKVDDQINLTFNETVIAGSGLFIISNGTDDTRAIDINDTNQVTFDGRKVTINPTDDLVVNTTYSVQIANGVIMDTVGHTYAGLSDAGYTTIATNPLLLGSNPSDYNTKFKPNDDIWLFFDERVMPGSGDIIISNGIDTRVIGINDTSQVAFNIDVSDNSGLVTINPSVDLDANTNYRVQISSGVIVDTTGHTYAGFSDANFTTIAPDPLLDFILLRSNDTTGQTGDSTDFKVGGSFALFFDEIVTAGSGSIIINHDVDTRTIDISDASQVNFINGWV